MTETSSNVGARPGRYLVVFKADTAPADANARIAHAGGRTKKIVGNIGVASFEGTDVVAAALRADPSVLTVGVEHVTKLPPVVVERRRGNPPVGQPTADDYLYGYQWDLRRIGAPAVWARSQSGARPRVAVLDTGVMTTHPDLVGQICGEKAFTYCAPAEAWPSVAYPAYDTLIDFDAHPDWDPSMGCSAAPLVFHAHGTHVSGTIAGKIGGGAIVGVAPNACVGAYKVFDRYRVTDPVDGLIDDVGAFDGPLFAAIVDATDSGYGVISMSLGGTLDLQYPEDQAAWESWKRVTNYANRHGAVIVAAAGNSALDLSGTLANVPSDLPHVIGVSATGSSNLVNSGTADAPVLNAAPGSDVLAFYSNYGKPIDLAAPGGDCGPQYPDACAFEHLILSSYIFETDQVDMDGVAVPAGSPGYAWFAGTSMATPHVAAVAAQVRALHPSWGTQDVRQHLKARAQPLGHKAWFGAGMLDADRSVR